MSKKTPNHRSILTVIFLVIICLIFIGFRYLANLLRPMNEQSSIAGHFRIEKGESISLIGSRLTQLGYIRSPMAFKIAIYLENAGSKIQAGDYALAPHMTARTIVKTLMHGEEEGIKFTIPEGYRSEQIAELAENKLGIKYADFMEAAKGHEGYLFPDTYNIANGTTAEELVKKLKNNWDLHMLSAVPNRDEIILASIIERETLSNEEKSIVSGILQKRLAEGWPLEVDATIQYMLGKPGNWWPITLLGDRKLKSPYNTYLNQGLPPTPICNPGEASLNAVINPKSSPYYFYLHDKEGVIHYAVTNAEHEANIGKYIR